jgi:hypothetical protein
MLNDISDYFYEKSYKHFKHLKLEFNKIRDDRANAVYIKEFNKIGKQKFPYDSK